MDTGEVVLVSPRREDFIFDLEFLLNGKGNEWRDGKTGAEAGPSEAVGE
jgi:hypothetical protein